MKTGVGRKTAEKVADKIKIKFFSWKKKFFLN
jgi:Holliday junction resolvasome RuvABC DNA-binding subunit